MQTRQNSVLNNQAAVLSYRLIGLIGDWHGEWLNSAWIDALSSRLLPGFYCRIHAEICLRNNVGYYNTESRPSVCAGAWVRLDF